MIWYFGISDKGVRRPHNEDAYRILRIKSGSGREFTLLMVADGVGGAEAGEVASWMACKVVGEEVRRAIEGTDSDALSDVEASLRGAVEAANRAVYQDGRGRDSGNAMATTLCAALMSGSVAVVANVGDSRAYEIVSGGNGGAQVRQVTVDHSLQQEWLAARKQTGEEGNSSATPPPRNVITRAIGSMEKVEPDLFRFKLSESGSLLLCTDGLTTAVPDELIGRIVGAEKSVRRTCRRLILAANRRGGPDNITLIIARRVSEDETHIGARASGG